jgi:hypothetical protein
LLVNARNGRAGVTAVGAQEDIEMCDYSLHHVMSRPAKVGDKIVTTNFFGTITRGFTGAGDPHVAVAFEKDIVQYDPTTHMPIRHEGQQVARFGQVNKDNPHTHHDALEFPDGRRVLVTHLCEGQKATVLQLPVSGRPVQEERKLEQPQDDAIPV